ncbi:MAG: hypothetical protein U0L92_05710 [Clostridia bacterium]|nr:hypothetical protein [Clostridia bacterium]
MKKKVLWIHIQRMVHRSENKAKSGGQTRFFTLFQAKKKPQKPLGY